MPRDGLKTSGGPRTGRSGRKKIVIRPYQKPPSLPANYYEDTARNLLQGTLNILRKNESEKTAVSLSLQDSYQAVIHLVSHQFGPRLYRELVQSMEQAAHMALNEDNNNENLTQSSLLRRLPAIYENYTQYLLCVQHVFLPLDRTHLWLPETKDVLVLRSAVTAGVEMNTSPSTGAAQVASGESNSVTPSSPDPQQQQQQQQNIWQVGLAVFGKRLRELQWDTRLYQEWLRALVYDWNPLDALPPEIADSSYNNVEENRFRRLQDLQTIWYFWQDLGWWSVLPLPQDLERYWHGVSLKWTAGGNTNNNNAATQLIAFLHAKHDHVHQWPWLPTAWLHGILEHCLIAPHLRESVQEKIVDPAPHKASLAFLKSSTAVTPEEPTPLLLLARENLDPILLAAIRGSGSSQTAATTTVSQLWMLAGRLSTGQARMAKALAQFAKRTAVACILPDAATGGGGAPSKPPNNLIADLLELQAAFSRLLALLPNALETVPLKQVWEETVNLEPPAGQSSVAENLAKFLDSILKSNKKMDQYQRESDQWLQRIISGIFVPLQAKDIFEAFYKKDLAKRLLWNRVVSMDVEKQVCSLLKAECGNAYTSKIEGMFQDIEFSRETTNIYKQSQPVSAPSESGSSVEMDVQVLTTGYWPVYAQYPNLNLPESLRKPQENFENHYKSKYQGRRMTWQFALGHCIVRCSGFPKVYELVVSLCHALVLVQFSTGSRLTIGELMGKIGLEDRDEMERILQSLSMAKEGTRILRKLDYDADPQKKRKIRNNVDDKDVFEINERFESNQRRIRITNIIAKETKEERDKTVEAVSRDRLYLIDAVLVRIMKARKTILHQALIPQVLEQVKVPAQPADVKKRIESLIEREYMERDHKDRNRYNYLA